MKMNLVSSAFFRMMFFHDKIDWLNELIVAIERIHKNQSLLIYLLVILEVQNMIKNTNICTINQITGDTKLTKKK